MVLVSCAAVAVTLGGRGRSVGGRGRAPWTVRCLPWRSLRWPRSSSCTPRGSAVGAGRRSMPLLRAQGHEVHTPTLTGLGERRPPGHARRSAWRRTSPTSSTSLSYEDLDDVVLGRQQLGRHGHHRRRRPGARADRPARLPRCLRAGRRPGHASTCCRPTVGRRSRRCVQAEGDGWLWPRLLPAAWEEIARTSWEIVDEADLAWVLPRLLPDARSGTSRSRRPSGVTPTCLRVCTSWDAVAPPRLRPVRRSTRGRALVGASGARRLAHPVRDVGRAARHDLLGLVADGRAAMGGFRRARAARSRPTVAVDAPSCRVGRVRRARAARGRPTPCVVS